MEWIKPVAGEAAMEYYAKSENLQGHQETVKEHLQKVAALAREYGEALGLADAAGLEGWYMILESIPRRFRMCGKANEQALTMR